MSGGFCVQDAVRGGMQKAVRQVSAGLLHPIGALRPGSPPLLHKRSTQQHWHMAGEPAPGIQSGAG